MMQSSMFLFHKDSRFRHAMMILVVPGEVENERAAEQQEFDESHAFFNSSWQAIQNLDLDKPGKNIRELADQVRRQSVQQPELTAKLAAGIRTFARQNSQNPLMRRNSIIMATTLEETQKKLLRMKQTGTSTSTAKSKAETKRERKRRKLPSKIFETIVLILILVSTCLLILDAPMLDPDSTFKTTLQNIDNVTTFFFLIEMMIKVVALGMFHNSLPSSIKPYLQNPWNVLDFIIVVTSIVDFGFTMDPNQSTSQLSAIKSLRVLRALRPLRMISRNEGLRVIVKALLSSLPAISNFSLIAGLFLFIFAIMGVNFFKGSFRTCDHATGVCQNKYENFDNVLNSMITLFAMMTTEGWADVMYSGIDATDPEHNPVRNNNPAYIIYFVLYMLIANVFLLSLFVGVVNDNFARIREKEEVGGIDFLTEAQKEWIEMQKFLIRRPLHLKQELPAHPGRLRVWRVVNGRTFEWFIMAVIIMNTIIMGIKYYRMDHDFLEALEIINYFFAAIYNIEAILKIFAFGGSYFKDLWNIFDFVIVLGTNTGIVLTFLVQGSSFHSTLTVIRGFRILRIGRLMRFSKSIKVILDSLVFILPSVTNVMGILLLMLTIFAILGMNLFGPVVHQTLINDRMNFENFGNSILLLFRCLTGEDWNVVMYEYAITPNNPDYTVNCITGETYARIVANGMVIQGCGSKLAFPFFIFFTIIMSLLILDLVIAVVIDGLEKSRKENFAYITQDQIDNIFNTWTEFDPRGEGWLDVKDLVFFLFELPPPIGFKRHYDLNMIDYALLEQKTDKYLFHEGTGLIIKRVEGIRLLNQLAIENLMIPVYTNEKVHFKDVIKMLVKRQLREHGIDF